MEGAAAVEEEEEEEEVAEGEQQQQEEQQQQGETRSSLGQNHPPSMGIAKTSTDSSQIFKDTCL